MFRILNSSWRCSASLSKMFSRGPLLMEQNRHRSIKAVKLSSSLPVDDVCCCCCCCCSLWCCCWRWCCCCCCWWWLVGIIKSDIFFRPVPHKNRQSSFALCLFKVEILPFEHRFKSCQYVCCSARTTRAALHRHPPRAHFTATPPHRCREGFSSLSFFHANICKH